jgi:hypothetical protein
MAIVGIGLSNMDLSDRERRNWSIYCNNGVDAFIYLIVETV